VSPISRMLDAGVSVGFGTDSAASTDDLNVLAEARFAWNLHRAINPDFGRDAREAVYRLTAGAAKAIAMDSTIGSLEAGKGADIAIFNISGASAVSRERPYDLVLWGNNPLRDLFVAGEKVLENDLYL
jgi:5-methylthioadenosine/S-adenosylhomocysteine deaminase